MKKLLSIILSVSLIMGLCSCMTFGASAEATKKYEKVSSVLGTLERNVYIDGIYYTVYNLGSSVFTAAVTDVEKNDIQGDELNVPNNITWDGKSVKVESFGLCLYDLDAKSDMTKLDFKAIRLPENVTQVYLSATKDKDSGTTIGTDIDLSSVETIYLGSKVMLISGIEEGEYYYSKFPNLKFDLSSGNKFFVIKDGKLTYSPNYEKEMEKWLEESLGDILGDISMDDLAKFSWSAKQVKAKKQIKVSFKDLKKYTYTLDGKKKVKSRTDKVQVRYKKTGAKKWKTTKKFNVKKKNKYNVVLKKGIKKGKKYKVCIRRCIKGKWKKWSKAKKVKIK